MKYAQIVKFLIVALPGFTLPTGLLAQYQSDGTMSNDSAGIQSYQDSIAASSSAMATSRQIYNEFTQWDYYYSAVSNSKLYFFSRFSDLSFQQTIRPELIRSYSYLVGHLDNGKPVRAERIIRRLQKVDNYNNNELLVVADAERILAKHSEG